MPAIDIRPVIDEKPWEDLNGSPYLNGNTLNLRMAGIPGGMVSGATAVAFALQLPDGSWVMFETSLQLLEAAVTAIKAGCERASKPQNPN